MSIVKMGYSEVEIEGAEDFDEVIEVDHGGGHEWSTLKAWYSPSRRRFFWLSDSGCSCNYFGQDVDSLSDFQDGDMDALLRAVKSHHEDEYPRGSFDDYERDRTTVRDYVAPKVEVSK